MLNLSHLSSVIDFEVSASMQRLEISAIPSLCTLFPALPRGKWTGSKSYVYVVDGYILARDPSYLLVRKSFCLLH